MRARAGQGRRPRARPEDAAGGAGAARRSAPRRRATPSSPPASAAGRAHAAADRLSPGARARRRVGRGARRALRRCDSRPTALARTLLRLHAERGVAIDVCRCQPTHAVARPARGSRRDARQPARQRLQVGTRVTSTSGASQMARRSSSPSTTMVTDWPRRCARRCCSAACAPTRRRPARASASPSSATWRSSTAARCRWAMRRAEGCRVELRLPR